MARLLALDIDPNGISLASADLVRGKLTCDRLLLTSTADPVPLSPDSARRLGESLRALLAEAKISPAPLLVSIPRDRVILKDVTYPRVGPKEEPAVVRFQATKDLTESPDRLLMDYVPTGKPQATPASASATTPPDQLRANAVFVSREMFDAAADLAQAAGVRLAGVTPRPFVFAAAIHSAIASGVVPAMSDTTAAYAVLVLNEHGGEFVVCLGDELEFSRSLPAAALESDASFLGEIRRNLAVFSSIRQTGSVCAIYVAEDSPSRSGRLRSALSIPVITLDPITVLRAGAPLAIAADEIPLARRAGFFAPLGLLAARATPAGLPINFTSTRQPRVEPNKNRKRVLIGVLVGVLLLAVGFLIGMMELSGAQREQRLLAQEKLSLAADAERLGKELKAMDAVEEFAGREVPWLDVYYDTSVQFPDIKKGKLISFAGELEKPPVVTQARPGQTRSTTASGTSLAGKKASSKSASDNLAKLPTARLKLLVASEDADLADRFKDAYRLPFYDKTTKETSKKEGSGDSLKLFNIDTFLLRRKPADFKDRLIASPPPALKIDPADVEPPDTPFIDPLISGSPDMGGSP